MDDLNNTNTPNNSAPTTPFGPPPPPIPDPMPSPFPQNPTPPPPPIPDPMTSFPQDPTTPPPWPAAPQDPTPTWNPPVQPEPVLPQPEPMPEPTPPVEPTPTFMPPQTGQPQTTSEPAIQPSWTASPETPPTPTESAPTDLSHLISSNLGQEPLTQQPTAETLVVPPVQNSTEEAAPSTNHKGIPRWLIGLAVGLLVLVAGASAYFILGIGQTKTATSLPATIAPKQSEVKPPPLPTPPIQPVATGSANFGELEGGGGGGTEQATSAADLIRQRNQQTPQ